MQAAPAPGPFTNPTVVSLFALGAVLVIVGLVYYWPLTAIGVLVLVAGFASPYVLRPYSTAQSYGPAAYAPAPYPAYGPPQYAPLAPSDLPAPSGPSPESVPPVPAPTGPPPSAPICPRCGGPITFVYEYQRWFCPAESVYPWG